VLIDHLVPLVINDDLQSSRRKSPAFWRNDQAGRRHPQNEPPAWIIPLDGEELKQVMPAGNFPDRPAHKGRGRVMDLAAALAFLAVHLPRRCVDPIEAFFWWSCGDAGAAEAGQLAQQPVILRQHVDVALAQGLHNR